MVRQIFSLWFVLLLVDASAVQAAQPSKPTDAPEDAARKYLQALKNKHYDDFVKSMHPDALKRFKGMMIPLVEAAAEQGQEKQILGLFLNATSVDELKKLDEQRFFLSFFRGLLRLRPELQEVLGGTDAQMLGHVLEGKDTAHVVFRMTATVAGAKMTKMSVISLQRSTQGWSVLLSGEIEGLANSLKGRFGKKN